MNIYQASGQFAESGPQIMGNHKHAVGATIYNTISAVHNNSNYQK